MDGGKHKQGCKVMRQQRWKMEDMVTDQRQADEQLEPWRRVTGNWQGLGMTAAAGQVPPNLGASERGPSAAMALWQPASVTTSLAAHYWPRLPSRTSTPGLGLATRATGTQSTVKRIPRL